MVYLTEIYGLPIKSKQFLNWKRKFLLDRFHKSKRPDNPNI